MSERVAWILTVLFGATSLVVMLVYMILLVNCGFLNIGFTVGMVMLFIVTGVFFRKASYMRTQRVVSDRADRLGGRDTDVEAARRFYGEE